MSLDRGPFSCKIWSVVHVLLRNLYTNIYIVYIHAYIHTYIYIYIHTFIYTYIHAHIYIHTYIYTYIHTIHTCIHTVEWNQGHIECLSVCVCVHFSKLLRELQRLNELLANYTRIKNNKLKPFGYKVITIFITHSYYYSYRVRVIV